MEADVSSSRTRAYETGENTRAVCLAGRHHVAHITELRKRMSGNEVVGVCDDCASLAGYTKPSMPSIREHVETGTAAGHQQVKGYKGSYLLRRNLGAEIEFITIMLWESIETIRAVAGADYETAVIPEERRQYLARYDAKSPTMK